MYLGNPGKDEQMADRHAVASGEEKNQDEENKMRDIHMGKRGTGDGKGGTVRS